MKTILNLCCAASFACVIAFAVGNIEPSQPGTVAIKTAGTSSDAIGSHARSKVLQYFDTYRSDPLGLPAECAAQMRSGEVPDAWMNSPISSGTVIGQSQRMALIQAPVELVRVLPVHSQNTRYFLAGNNFVVIDSAYKVVDSIRIPTVRLPEGEMPVASNEPVQFVRHMDRRGR